MLEAAPATEMRAASMACCSVILWSIRLIVTFTTELMIVAPPGEPYARKGLPSGVNSIVGAMLLRGRLPG